MAATVKPFGTFLNLLVTRYGGTKRDLAALVGVSPFHFSRLLSGETAPTIALCLNLADTTGTAATLVLRAARFDQVATQLERLFGSVVAQPQPPCYPLTPLECQHIEQWRRLEPRARKALMTIIETQLERVPVAPRRPHRRLAAARSA